MTSTSDVNMINLQVLAEDQIAIDRANGTYDANRASDPKYYFWHSEFQTIPVGMDGNPEQFAQQLRASLPQVNTLRLPFNEHSFNADGTLHEQYERFLHAAAAEGFENWGSTRPREPSGFASRPIARIDYPTNRSWSIARNKEDEWGFEEAAAAIMASPDWNGSLGIWGEEMIEATIISEELGIDTPQKNVAARVNIHLHLQSFYGAGDVGGMNLDEDWED